MPLTPAEVVRKKTINSPQIVSIVNDLITSIDSGIIAASVETNRYDHHMPQDIFIPSLSKANAQRIVYYHVSKQLQKAGYTVEITMSKSVIFHISWVTDMGQSDINKIDRYLAGLKRNPAKPKQPVKNEPKKVDLELNDFYQDIDDKK
jgi:hypothetical protein